MLSLSVDRKMLEPLAAVLGCTGAWKLIIQSDPEMVSVFPKEAKFCPDFAIETPSGFAFGHIVSDVSDPVLATRVTRSAAILKASGTKVVVLATASPEDSADRIGGKLVETCLEHGFGLALALDGIAVLVFPPGYVPVPPPEYAIEHGHIPSWVLQQVLTCGELSQHMAGCVAWLLQEYQVLVAPPSYANETSILLQFARKIAEGMPRMFFPANRIAMLAEYEATVQSKTARDHFYHTFNDFLLGLLVLGNLINSSEQEVKSPDKFIKNGVGEGLHSWEAIWTLTALFHDPGYLAERSGSMLNLALGLPDNGERDVTEVTEAQSSQLSEAWVTSYGDAVRDLRELWGRFVGQYMAAGSARAVELDRVLRSCYFDGSRVGHSIASALALIHRCQTDIAYKDVAYDRDSSLTACQVAGLSMMFHDQKAREKLAESEFAPPGFADLPYASTLVLVDALQDDRRDITVATWPSRELLISITAGDYSVRATVDLRALPVQWWPWKIAEYENAASWINKAGGIDVQIDYRTIAGLN